MPTRLLATLAALFVLLAGATLILTGYWRFGAVDWLLIAALAGWLLCGEAALFFTRRALPRHDPYLLPITYFLSGWGLFLIWRLAPGFGLRQLAWLGVATAVLIVIIHLPRDLRWLRRYRYTWLIGGLGLTALTLLFGVNPSGFGQELWLGCCGVYLQPAEILKLLLVAFLASYLAEKREQIFFQHQEIQSLTSNVQNPMSNAQSLKTDVQRPMPDVHNQSVAIPKRKSKKRKATGEKRKADAQNPASNVASPTSDAQHLPVTTRRWTLDVGQRTLPAPAYLLPMLLMWGFSMLILLIQRDLGMSTVFFSVFIIMLYLASGRTSYVLLGIFLLALAGVVGYGAFDVVRLRVEAWWNPWADAPGRSYQIVQSLIALAAGGLFGRGPGLGHANLIPVAHSDFVFAALAEEWGLIGALGLLGALNVLILRGLNLALTARGLFNQLLAGGLTALLGLPALLIVGGVIKLIPLTGLTLPFISYGGSSLVTNFVIVALLLQLSNSDYQTRG